MPNAVRYIYEFGPFRLDTATRLLSRDDDIVQLTPQALDTLIALVERNQQVVSKGDLIRRVWPEAQVDEYFLAQQISILRKVLGSLEDNQLIETVPRRGYRFSVSVLLATEAGAPISSHSNASSHSGKGSLSGGAGSQSGHGDLPATATVRIPKRISTIRPGTLAGRYEILSLLGSGGMGKVYLARDTQLDRKVALKLLSDKFTRNKDWMYRFVREARAISALNHPNIITVHEVGEVDGHHFIATEHIEGNTLRVQMVAGRMAISAALNVATQLGGALEAAHAAGIVHRDIKPENVMVRPDGYVKLLDFGLAKPLKGEAHLQSRLETTPGIILGTVNYMSPEQARGLPVDARSDVFSLGILLYEMLAGAAPFDGSTPSDAMAAILERQPSPLSSLLPGAPPELDRIVAKALRKDREERYQTIKDLLLDLKALQQELELRARFGDAWMRDAATSSPVPRAETPSAVRTTSGSTAVIHSSRLDSEAHFEIPDVHYARSGEINIAYQVIGEGPMDLVFVMGWISHLEYFWTEGSFARFLLRLASFARVILFDKRGTGLSDRVPIDQLPTLEQRMDDVRAVMDAVGSERAVLCGVSEGGPMCSLFAATHPEKTIALVMIGSYARRLKGEGYPWGPTEADRDLFLEEIRNHWGGPVGLEDRAPSVADDPAFRAWWAAYLRRGASPGAAVALTRMNTEIDIRHVLPTVRVPTLVVHRTGDQCLKVQEGKYLADNIPGAKFVELPGVDHLPFVGAQDEILDEIEEFLTGVRHASACDRVLATVLVARMGAHSDDSVSLDNPLTRHQVFLRKELELFKGSAIEIGADRVLASFDGPARAIRAACAVRAAAQRLGIHLHTGLHTGECDLMGARIGGPAVDIAKQVAAESALSEVLVSSTVKDLVAGSGIRFTERGPRSLGRNLGEWRLFAVG